MTLLVLAFVILLIIGMPVAFVVGLAGVAFFASTADLPFSISSPRPSPIRSLRSRSLFSRAR